MKALKPCIVCGRPSSESRCPTHQLKSRSTRQWQALRARVLLRDGHRCRRCGSRENLTADHITPLSKGRDVLPPMTALQTLCSTCNTKKGNRAA